MDTQSIVVEINHQIENLTKARDLLMGTSNGHSRNVVNISASADPIAARRRSAEPPRSPTAARKGSMSPEGRKRIAEAMKARWAAKRAVLSAPEAKTVRAVAKALKKR